MPRRIRGSIAATLAAALLMTSIEIAPAQAASAQPQVQAAGSLELSARHRHYRHHRGNRAALYAFGAVASTIIGIAAAEQARRDCRRYGYCGYGYGYRPPPPYYGYGPYYRY